MQRTLSFRVALRLGILVALVGSALGVVVPSLATAQTSKASYTTKLVLLGPGSLIGALYQPTTPDPRSAIGIYITHEDANVVGSIVCLQLAQRGFTVLCANTQFTDQGAVIWDTIAQDVGYGVSYLRSLSGVNRVVLLGYSGGGPIMAYYQNVALNGVATCQAPERLDPCGSNLAGLPPADGVILGDAIPGLAFAFMSSLDVSVVDDPTGTRRDEVDESLNMFSARNGYNPNGSSNYRRRFIDRYTAAQGRRENELVEAALRIKSAIAAGRGPFTDDAPFPIGRDAARIWQADDALISHTQGPYPVITPTAPNGMVEVATSVRVPSASPSANASWASGGKRFTVKSFLSTDAILTDGTYHLTADSISGVNWASSNTSTILNVKGITSPMLIMSMTGHYWLVSSEEYYRNARSTDKTLVFVEGASHSLTPCKPCEKVPGEFGDTVSEIFNYIANWIMARF